MSERIKESTQNILDGKSLIKSAIGLSTSNPTFKQLADGVKNINQENINGRNSVRTAIINKDNKVVIPTNPNYSQLVAGVNSISASKIEYTLPTKPETSLIEKLATGGIYSYSNDGSGANGYWWDMAKTLGEKIYEYTDTATVYIYDKILNVWSYIGVVSGDSDTRLGRNGKLYSVKYDRTGNSTDNSTYHCYDLTTKISTQVLAFSYAFGKFGRFTTQIRLNWKDEINIFLTKKENRANRILNKFNLITNTITETSVKFNTGTYNGSESVYSGFAWGANFSENSTYIITSREVSQEACLGSLLNESSLTTTQIFDIGTGIYLKRSGLGYGISNQLVDLGYGLFLVNNKIFDFNRKVSYTPNININKNNIIACDNVEMKYYTADPDNYSYSKSVKLFQKSSFSTFHFNPNDISGTIYIHNLSLNSLLSTGINVKIKGFNERIDNNINSPYITHNDYYIPKENILVDSSSVIFELSK